MKTNFLDRRCPQCGSPAEKIHEGLTIGEKCTRCNWSVVTTYIPSIEQDDTLYSINLKNANHHDKDQIKAISKIAGINFLQARNLLQKEKIIVFKGKATEIKLIKSILENANISINIHPKFNW
ncbi:hypothetical protein [Comamonas endophytica]|uniref:Uncharacterized protein n=1 Tax=Comamonas endophytica TaxID=2949090 RepID=A0ABY6G980_9BURK|nr:MULTISPECIES: hypothetical protein [unclassified Acidovorax]MCD2511653.1 hypothetical protein [Acidovorax sp. D4N7]UYG51034.1 hypothetical protein M9799_13175 [Acidovorax sp. 5MLIR]